MSSKRTTIEVEIEEWAWPQAKEQLKEITGVSSIQWPERLDRVNEE